MNKKLKRILSILMAVMMLVMIVVPASAATTENAIIDSSRTGSFTIYKYDLTTAKRDGLSAGYANGERDSQVEADFANYAVKGVEFSYLKVADFKTYTVAEDGQNVTYLTYAFEADDELLDIIGLDESLSVSPVDADSDLRYFISDDIMAAVKAALLENRVATKNALEAYMGDNGTKFDETDDYGMTTVDGLALGLYLIVETAVPEMVTSTVDPFFVSLPMTDDEGDNWMYDLFLYPKNETGNPDFEKQVINDEDYKGWSEQDSATDDWSHATTASAGEIVRYRLISTLPTITSDATALTLYTMKDRVSKGLEYDADSVTISFYEDIDTAKADVDGTDAAFTWVQGTSNPMFTVSVDNTDYTDKEYHELIVEMTAAGLAFINDQDYGTETAQLAQLSNYTMVVNYDTKVMSDDTVVFGDDGNPNAAELTWQRTNDEYFDTITDEAIVYTFALDLTKTFSDNKGVMADVKFTLRNVSDDFFSDVDGEFQTITDVSNADKTNPDYIAGSYYMVANNPEDGVYYITGKTLVESEATIFTPDDDGKLFINGLEADTYALTEVETADGYTLLEKDIIIVITSSVATKTTTDRSETHYTRYYDTTTSSDYDFIIPTDESRGYDSIVYTSVGASATVDGNDVTMLSSGNVSAINADGSTEDESENAIVPLKIVNTKTWVPNLPQTGGNGVWMVTIIGVLGALIATIVIIRYRRKEDSNEAA